MSRTYKNILFDWDGCIAQTLSVHLQAYKETFSDYQLHPTDVQIVTEVFGDWNGPVKFGVQDIGTFTSIFLARVARLFFSAPLYPHALETIQTLSAAGKKIALVTTSSKSLILPALQHSQMKDYFMLVLTAEDVQEHKPSPEIINKALLLLDASKEETILIGDSKNDLGAANNAGIESVLFFPSDHEQWYDRQLLLQSYNPTFCISDHSQLLQVFNIMKPTAE